MICKSLLFLPIFVNLLLVHGKNFKLILKRKEKSSIVFRKNNIEWKMWWEYGQFAYASMLPRTYRFKYRCNICWECVLYGRIITLPVCVFTFRCYSFDFCCFVDKKKGLQWKCVVSSLFIFDIWCEWYLFIRSISIFIWIFKDLLEISNEFVFCRQK